MRLTLRPADCADMSDRSFIISTWSSSYKESRYAGIISDEDWGTVMHPQFEKHLDRDDTRAIIACDRNDGSQFYGWIAGNILERTPVVFFVYVKIAYRRVGIARRLFEALGVDPQRRFVYPCGMSIAIDLAHKIPLAKLNPNGLRYTRETRRDPL